MAPHRPAAGVYAAPSPAQQTARVRQAGLNRFFDQVAAVLAKDVKAELRNRAATNAILLFAVCTLVVVGYAVGNVKPSPEVKSSLLWVILFFAAFSGLSHVFLHEEDSGTSMALKLTASPGAVYAGKLLFNQLLLAAIAVIIAPLFAVMLELNPISLWGFLGVLTTGCIGLAAAATIVAAIIARARGKGALFGALGFPILLPLLLIAVHGTRLSMLRFAPREEIARDITGLACFGILIITVSALLFPYVWEE